MRSPGFARADASANANRPWAAPRSPSAAATSDAWFGAAIPVARPMSRHRPASRLVDSGVLDVGGAKSRHRERVADGRRENRGDGGLAHEPLFVGVGLGMLARRINVNEIVGEARPSEKTGGALVGNHEPRRRRRPATDAAESPGGPAAFRRPQRAWTRGQAARREAPRRRSAASPKRPWLAFRRATRARPRREPPAGARRRERTWTRTPRCRGARAPDARPRRQGSRDPRPIRRRRAVLRRGRRARKISGLSRRNPDRAAGAAHRPPHWRSLSSPIAFASACKRSLPF